MRMTLAEAAQAMQGTLVGVDTSFSGVTTDSRQVGPGTLFVALRGARHDGHDHVAGARTAGAVAAVVSRDDAGLGTPRIVVADTQLALGRLARAWRERLSPVVVAITGNSGKTTTKELTAAVLRAAAPTLATAGNFNNEIGMPLTLLKLDDTHRYAVIEMGQGRPGDIAYLVDIARPDIALVTNVTGAHLAAFDGMEAIAAGKGEVYGALAPAGTALVNLDDVFAAFWLARLPACRRVTFGVATAADVRAVNVRLADDGCARFDLLAGGAQVAVVLAIPGIHNVSNALAAAAVGITCGLAPAMIAAALATVQPVSGRLVVRELAGGIRLVDDTYNANPGSMKAAISTLCGWQGNRLLVLGDMAELGPTAAELHRDVGAFARAAGVDRLFAVGAHATDTVAGFGDGGQAFTDTETLVASLRPALAGGATVLIKGSRSARMERVVAAITGEQDAALAH